MSIGFGITSPLFYGDVAVIDETDEEDYEDYEYVLPEFTGITSDTAVEEIIAIIEKER